MIVDNPMIVQLALDSIFTGPASLCGDVATFLYQGPVKQRKFARGSVDGVAGRFTVERTKDFDPVARPFLQAIRNEGA